jgi:hypothetical protein
MDGDTAPVTELIGVCRLSVATAGCRRLFENLEIDRRRNLRQECYRTE